MIELRIVFSANRSTFHFYDAESDEMRRETDLLWDDSSKHQIKVGDQIKSEEKGFDSSSRANASRSASENKTRSFRRLMSLSQVNISGFEMRQSPHRSRACAMHWPFWRNMNEDIKTCKKKLRELGGARHIKSLMWLSGMQSLRAKCEQSKTIVVQTWKGSASHLQSPHR